MHARNFARPLLAAVFVALGISAQASGPPVTADKIVLHDEFIPRFASYLTRVLRVPAGKTVTLPPDSTWDAIEVAGTLRVSRTHDTVCRFTHLTILPGGTLDAGTATDPVLTRVELVIRDVPIDTARDPYQWGNGIINLGHQSRVGRRVAQAWTELTEDAEAGTTTIRFAVPDGWQVGDELFLPDLRQIQPVRNAASIRRESPVTVVAIDGDVVTLSKPLDFEHRSILDPDGQVVARPRVANLTRNIVLRSENPIGARGHTVNTGSATWDIRYNRLIGLGRTRLEKLDSTKADPDTGKITHIGTNQIARYASHDHHVHVHAKGRSAQGHAHGRQLVGNVLEGDAIGKWGHVVHGTHDTHVEENIAVGFAGAGFVTEDGYEVRNVFRRNVAIGTAGNGISAVGNIAPRSGRDCPGCEGAGFWFRGLHQVIEQNEAWNNAVGINLFAVLQVTTVKVPREVGDNADAPFDARRAAPLSFSRNVTLSNVQTGLEYWSTPRFPAQEHLSAHNGEKQMFAGQSEGTHIYLMHPTLIAGGGLTDGVSSSEAYVASLEVDGGRIAGCRQAFQRSGARNFVHLKNLTLQCVTNINFPGPAFGEESLYENVKHRPYANHPTRFMVLGRNEPWQPGQKLIGLSVTAWVPARGTRHIVRNWQGTGEDYRLYSTQQLASVPAWPATGEYGTAVYCPEEGLTMGECWQRYGLAYGGGVVPDEVAVKLDGLVNGVARPGVQNVLGVPRAVVTTPNMLAPATLQGASGKQRVTLRVVLTGDPARASGAAMVKVDGEKPFQCATVPGQLEELRSCNTDAVSPGTHTIRTWREDKSGDKIPESELVFKYDVPDPEAAETARAEHLAEQRGMTR